MTQNPTTRFLSIRLTEDEYQEVYRYLQQSSCRSLTEYVKKVLTSKPVTVKVRDQSRDEILQQLILVKSRLEALVDKAPAHDGAALLDEMNDIKVFIRQIADKCSPGQSPQ